MLVHRLRRWPNIETTLRQRMTSIAANTTHSPNVSLMLGHRLRRWPNIKPTLVEHLWFCDSLVDGGGGGIDAGEHRYRTRGVSIQPHPQTSWFHWEYWESGILRTNPLVENPFNLIKKGTLQDHRGLETNFRTYIGLEEEKNRFFFHGFLHQFFFHAICNTRKPRWTRHFSDWFNFFRVCDGFTWEIEENKRRISRRYACCRGLCFHSRAHAGLFCVCSGHWARKSKIILGLTFKAHGTRGIVPMMA